MEVIAKTEYEERVMLNHFKHWDCEVPTAAVSVLSNAAVYNVASFSVEDVKYLQLVVRA